MDIRTDEEIVRNDDGTLTVSIAADRHDAEDGEPSGPSTMAAPV